MSPSKKSPSKSKSRRARDRAIAINAAQVAEWCLWLLLLLLWIVHDRQLKDAFRLPKLQLAETLTLVSLVLLAWHLRCAGRIEWRQLRGVPVLRATLPLFAAALLSAAASDYPVHTMTALASLAIALAALVAWSLGLPRPRLEQLVHGLIWPAVGLALVAILQFHDLWRPFDFAGNVEQERLGVTSFAGSAGDLAMFLLLPCLVVQERLFRLWGGRRGGKHSSALVLWAVALLLCVYGLAVSGTVSALGVLGVASFALWWWLLPRRLAVPLLGGLAVAGVAVLLVAAPLRERVVPKVQQLVRGDVDDALTGRLDGWKAAGWMLRENPLLGVGHGAFRPEFADAKLALTERGVEFYRGQNFVVFANAHNEYLEVAAEWGLFGVAALLWALWQLLQRLRSLAGARGGAAEREHRLSPEAALACAGTLALALIATVQFPFRLALTGYAAVLWLAWIFAPTDEEAA